MTTWLVCCINVSIETDLAQTLVIEGSLFRWVCQCIQTCYLSLQQRARLQMFNLKTPSSDDLPAHSLPPFPSNGLHGPPVIANGGWIIIAHRPRSRNPELNSLPLKYSKFAIGYECTPVILMTRWDNASPNELWLTLWSWQRTGSQQIGRVMYKWRPQCMAQFWLIFFSLLPQFRW